MIELICPGCRANLSFERDGARCESCRMVYPMLDGDILDLRHASSRTEEGFNQEPIWDKHSAGAPTTPVDALECRNDLKSLLFRTLGDRIGWPGKGSMTIDLGSFDGSVSRNWTLRYGTRIVGVDASALAIRRARRADPFENEYQLATLEALPFRDATFDAALSLDVFEHLGDPLPAMREAARVMKPGAPFLFYVVSSKGTGTWDWWRYHFRRVSGATVPERFGDNPEGGHWANNLVDPNDFRGYCRETGLALEGVRPFHAFFTAFLDDVARGWFVNRRAQSGAAEIPMTESREPGRQAVLDPERISPAKRRRLRWVHRIFAAADLLDLPWRAVDVGRGFAAWGQRSP